jgi:lipoate-protein ligase A
MAIDESLLADVKPDDPVTIRLYRWIEPTLSIGHFQSIEQWKRDPRTCNAKSLGDIPWVRRKTGGGAILHDREWTYSIVIPARLNHLAKGHSEILYRAVHRSILKGLQLLGWPAGLSEDCSCSAATRGDGEPFLCFQRRSPVDLVVGDHKILGSAQRRQRAGLLQHGSLLIRSSSIYPELLGLEEIRAENSVSVDWESWMEEYLRMGLRHATQFTTRPNSIAENIG